MYLPKPPSTLITDSFDCQDLTSTTFPGSEDSTFRISVSNRSHWYPTSLAVPITLCDCRDRPYAPITSYVAPEATECGTSFQIKSAVFINSGVSQVLRKQRLQKLKVSSPWRLCSIYSSKLNVLEKTGRDF